MRPDHHQPEKREENCVNDGACIRFLWLRGLPSESLVPNPEVNRDEATEPEKYLGPDDAEDSMSVFDTTVPSSYNLFFSIKLFHEFNKNANP